MAVVSLFTTDRERRLWYWAAAVVIAIYATLGFAGSLAEVLRERRQLDGLFVIAFFVLVGAMAGLALKERPSWREAWVGLAVVAVYAMAFIRLGIAERTHLFEYGLVGVLVYHALLERRRGGGRVRAPAVVAVVGTALLGSLDEAIQWVLPNRVFDVVDMGFNALAALMSVLATVALAWARRSIGRRGAAP